jgi:hypothetical protein
MASETLYATSLTSGAVATSANALGAANSTWTTDTGSTSWTARFAMGNPVGNQANGTHSIVVYARKIAGQSGTPVVNSVTLYTSAGGSLGQVIGSTNVTSTTSQSVTAGFDSAILAGVDLNSIDVEIVTTAAGGSPGVRTPVQIDAIHWVGDFTTVAPGPGEGSASGTFTFAGAAAGKRTPKGAATGSFSFAGAAVGSAPSSGPGEGSAIGTLAYVGTAVGDAPGSTPINAINLLTAGDTSNIDVFTTGSIAPAANRLLLFFGVSSGTNPAPNGVVTGLGLTWSTPAPVNAAAKTQWMSWAVTGPSAPTPGGLTVTHGVAITGLAYSIVEVEAADLVSPVVQSEFVRVGSTSTSATVTLPSAISSTDNATVAMFWNQGGEAMTPGGSYVELGEASHSAPLTGIMSSWLLPGTTTPSASWTSQFIGGGIAVEVKATPVGVLGEGSATGSVAYEGVAVGPISKPTFISSSHDWKENSNSLTLPAPGGLQAGHLQFAIVGFNSGDEPINNTPSGWTQVLAYNNPHAEGGAGENERVEVWTSTTDTGDLTFTKGGSVVRWHGLRAVYAGAASASAISSQPQNGSLTRATTHPIPSQTTTVADELVIGFLTSETKIDEVWTSPGGWVERYEANYGSAGLDPLHISLIDRSEPSPTTVSGSSFTSATTNWSTIGSLRLIPSSIPEGSATGTVSYSGTATGARTPKGSASGTLAYVGTATGSTTRSGSVTGAWAFVGTATGQKAQRGSASGMWALTGTASGARTPKGVAAGGWSFAGAATGVRAPEGLSDGTWAFSGSATGTAPTVGMSEGSASGTFAFNGVGVGDVPANDGTATGSVAFTGTATGSTTRSGVSAGSFTFTGSAAGVRQPEGAGSGAFTFNGAASGKRLPEGSGTGSVDWTGSASGTTTRRGESSGSWSLAGSASGITVRRGAAAGTFTFAGGAVGTTARRGTASGTFSFTGSASGSATSNAFGAGEWSFTGSATGYRAPEAAGSGVWAFSGAADGSSPRRGTAGGSTAFTGSATGKRIAGGTASGTVSWTGSAIGERQPEASTTGSVLWIGTAVGNGSEPDESTGAGTGQAVWSGSATGERPKRGSASGSTEWSATATGYRLPKGAGAGSFVLSGSAVGRRTPEGAVVGHVVYIGTASGGTLLSGTGDGVTLWTGAATGEQSIVVEGDFIVGPAKPPRFVTTGSPHPEEPERYRSDEPRSSRFTSGGAG